MRLLARSLTEQLPPPTFPHSRARSRHTFAMGSKRKRCMNKENIQARGYAQPPQMMMMPGAMGMMPGMATTSMMVPGMQGFHSVPGLNGVPGANGVPGVPGVQPGAGAEEPDSDSSSSTSVEKPPKKKRKSA